MYKWLYNNGKPGHVSAYLAFFKHKRRQESDLGEKLVHDLAGRAPCRKKYSEYI